MIDIKWIFVVLLMVSLGCSSPPKVDPAKQADLESFAGAQKLLHSKSFEEALTRFEMHLQKYPTSPWQLQAQLGRAEALYYVSRYEESAEGFEKVLSSTLVSNSKSLLELRAQSLFRLGQIYQALGQESQSSARLFDAQALAQHLPPKIKDVELPFMLALKASQSGDLSESQRQSQTLLRGLSQQSASWTLDEQAQMYFNLGRLTDRTIDAINFENVTHELMIKQQLLLRCIELGVLAYRNLALNALLGQYNRLDQVLQAESDKNQQLRMAELGVESLTRLKNFLAVGSSGTSYPPELDQFVTDIERKWLQRYIYRSNQTKN